MNLDTILSLLCIIHTECSVSHSLIIFFFNTNIHKFTVAKLQFHYLFYVWCFTVQKIGLDKWGSTVYKIFKYGNFSKCFCMRHVRKARASRQLKDYKWRSKTFIYAKKYLHTYSTFQHSCHPSRNTFGIVHQLLYPFLEELCCQWLWPFSDTGFQHLCSLKTLQTEPFIDVVVAWCKIRTVGKVEENFPFEIFDLFNGSHCSVGACIVMQKNDSCAQLPVLFVLDCLPQFLYKVLQ